MKTFKDLTKDVGFIIKIVWNRKTIYEDSDELYIEGKPVERSAVAYSNACNNLMLKYGDKKMYYYTCKTVHIHHTELYIIGEEI